MHAKICLIGSTKFENIFRQLETELSKKGYIVLSPLVYTQSGLNPDCGMDCKKILDDVQMQKVQISDMVLVVDENGYIGPSTKKQLNYAKLLKKVIFFYSKGGHKKL